MLSALWLGIIEGLTEFLPISSTAHLIIFNRLLGLFQNQYWQFFEVVVQAGAVLAVITLYFQKLLDWKLNCKLLVSFLPTALTGAIFYKAIKEVFFKNLTLIAINLIVFGLLFLLLEWLIKTNRLVLKRKLKQLTIKQSLCIGLFQSLAVVPGVSRSGAVLVGGLLLGYKRQEAGQYSFLLAVPTICAAALFDLFKTDFAVVSDNLNLTLIGLIGAYLSALLVMRWFIRFLQTHNLVIFAVYRILLGLLLLIFLI